ncbi:MAG: hypothetical protein KC547_09315, partial [Anaerolineae bacterium]|nr:hypothetical protein [Anaerolineae bacterium]
MGSRNSQSNDGGDAVAGCALLIIGLLGFLLWDWLRPKPQPYAPDSLDAEKVAGKSSEELTIRDVAAGFSVLLWMGVGIFLLSEQVPLFAGIAIMLPFTGLAMVAVNWASKPDPKKLAAAAAEAEAKAAAAARPSPSIIYTLHPPSDREPDHAVDLKLISELTGAYPGLMYQIHGNGRQ